MGRFPTRKFKLWSGQPVNAPDVMPPMALRVMVILSVLSVTGTLIYGVTQQLAIGGTPEISVLKAMTIAGFYFVLPVLIALTILTNRSVSRFLILTYAAFVSFQLLNSFDVSRDITADRISFMMSILVFLLALVWWLYRSARMRIYYRLISGHPDAADLKTYEDLISVPGTVEGWFLSLSKRVAPYFEMATGLLIVVFVVLAIAQMF
ncbi:MAG: hypothetical protein GXP15_13695 [Gammaproteobacteria bacterium]|nr:hypothetical protein [Gammaproteobacteria bacterium]